MKTLCKKTTEAVNASLIIEYLYYNIHKNF